MTNWKERMDTHRRVGMQVREIRTTGKNQLTQARLAHFIGCTPSAISYLETGKGGSLQLVEAVTWALGIDLSALRVVNPRAVTSINRGRSQLRRRRAA
jgi:DNA-binding XRE family transcriptional regulator